ncbi:MAG: NAD(P)-binding protein, partial [Proteobacteria bacterium]|nr:NAD(P)-binding protein [Pseudomonadota bacterium]
MKRRFEIVIVGGGVTGLTLATLLGKCDHADALDITLIEAAPRPSFSVKDPVALRVSAIAS